MTDAEPFGELLAVMPAHGDDFFHAILVPGEGAAVGIPVAHGADAALRQRGRVAAALKRVARRALGVCTGPLALGAPQRAAERAHFLHAVHVPGEVAAVGIEIAYAAHARLPAVADRIALRAPVVDAGADVRALHAARGLPPASHEGGHGPDQVVEDVARVRPLRIDPGRARDEEPTARVGERGIEGSRDLVAGRSGLRRP